MASKIQVDGIEGADPPLTPVVLTYGATVPAGQTISGGGGINVTGIVTASSFNGSGSGLTNLTIATRGKAFALVFIT